MKTRVLWCVTVFELSLSNSDVWVTWEQVPKTKDLKVSLVIQEVVKENMMSSVMMS